MVSAVRVLGGAIDSVKTVNTVKNVSKIDTIGKIVSVGSSDGTPGIHIASLPCPKVNDEGLTGGWQIVDGIAKAAALLASVRALQAARQQDKIARTYYKLAEQQWNFYKENYVPLEIREIDEVHKEKPFTADYVTSIKSHDCTGPVFASTQDHRDKIFNEYCVSPDPTMDIRYNIALSTVRGDTYNFARRYAEALAERKDDIRWNKKLAVASRGRNLLPQSLDFANRASSMFGAYSNAMSGLAGDAMKFSGYIRNRYETQFNAQRADSITRISDPRYTEYTNHTIGQPLNGYSDAYKKYANSTPTVLTPTDAFNTEFYGNPAGYANTTPVNYEDLGSDNITIEYSNNEYY